MIIQGSANQIPLADKSVKIKCSDRVETEMIIQASAHQIPLKDCSIHAVCCSPPYFGLRRYAGAQDVEWPGGNYSPMTGCPLCIEVPAMRASLGNESTIEAFIWHLLLVMRELKRVLRDDGTCWINLGDSYSGSGKGGNPENSQFQKQATNFGSLIAPAKLESEIAGGNLLAIPHRFALAAQADGWVLRNDCVWHKKSAMPESVSGWRFSGDDLRRGSWRHTRVHEMVFQFTKGMGYWSDGEVVKEPSNSSSDARLRRGVSNNHKMLNVDGRSVHSLHKSCANGDGYSAEGQRNPRSVFSPSPSPLKDEHYAAFPVDLVRPFVMASTPRKCCSECGRGYAPVVSGLKFDRSQDRPYGGMNGNPSGKVPTSNTRGCPDPQSYVTSYRATCDCNSPTIPGTVLDPFCGSGTVGIAAREWGVRFIGLDISAQYNKLAEWRTEGKATPKVDEMPLFAGVAA